MHRPPNRPSSLTKQFTSALLAILPPLCLLCPAPAFAQELALAQPQVEMDPAPGRSLGVQPARTVLVKALGQGLTPQEAEAAAIKRARNLATQHLKQLGGALALLPGDEDARIVNLRHFPVMGMGQARVVVLLELRLRGQAEPLPPGLPLPVLNASVANGVLHLEANRACEAVAALDLGKNVEPELLPGGTQPFRLSPGKAVEQPLPHTEGQHLRVLACTGGLSIPASPATVDEAFTKARAGRPHPSILEGVVSDCVELRLGQVPGRPSAPPKDPAH